MSDFVRDRALPVTVELEVVKVFGVCNIVSMSRSGACGVGSFSQ